MFHAKSKLKSAECHVKVIKADGTIEDHGCVAYWHRNPIRRFIWKRRNPNGRIADARRVP